MSVALRLPSCILALALASSMSATAQAQDSQPPANQSPAAPTEAQPPKNRVLPKEFVHDVGAFFSAETAQLLAVSAVASIAAVPWDREGVSEAPELPKGAFTFGNVSGSFPFQLGVGGAVWGFGVTTRHPKAADIGRDLVRAQLLSQSLVQVVKVIVRRPRPDGSNNYSFPSGHSASAFAMASVLNRHLGWKVGIPAYAYGVYVGAARMQANKHHISDVVMGAGFGIASGRVVTLHLGRQAFGVGVAPTEGGAAIMFTRRTR